MFDFNAPHITDEGLKALGNVGYGYAALLDTQAVRVAVFGAVLLGGCWFAFEVRKEMRSGTVKHEVLHR